MSLCSTDNFAVVEFNADIHEPHKRLIEVIRFSWLTEDAQKCFCPKSKNWSYELKNCGLPRADWIKYDCRVLKYNIDTLKAANAECSLRLNFTTSDFSEGDENNTPHQSEKATINASITTSYNDLFDEIDEGFALPIVSKNNFNENTNTEKPTNTIETVSLTNVAAVNDLVFVPHQLNASLENLANVNNSEVLTVTVNQLQTNVEKMSAQMEVLLKMVMDLNKKSTVPSSFVPVCNISSKQELDDLEEKLANAEFKDNMAYAYTQYAWKGDAKKEVNGFVTSILNKLLSDQFSHQCKWDRIKKGDNNMQTEVDAIIFFKKYSNILDFLTDVCNKTKKEGSAFYNKDNTSQASQDYFKRKIFTKNV